MPINHDRTAAQAFEDGMAVRRRILGEEYVANSKARLAAAVNVSNIPSITSPKP